MTLYALLNSGFLAEAAAWRDWLLRAVARTLPDVHVFYDIHGGTVSGEQQLELAGYRGSRPVRRGNQAAKQLQLGCWGDLLETAELYVRDVNASASPVPEPASATLLGLGVVAFFGYRRRR